ncbi:MAG: hypothetical protein LBD20_04040 [Spirochaetaceae bacterium]|jgi:hypothetical protein|nr:hypothetical protein [Spirochaetaceae bacterium]
MGCNFRQNLSGELDWQNLTVTELAAKASVAKGALDTYLGRNETMPPADVAVCVSQTRLK